MNIIYIANARIPTEKAYGINMMKTCEALAEQVLGEGASLVVYAPKRVHTLKQDVFEYYGLKKTFEIRYLPIIDFVGRNIPLGFWINQVTFTLSVVSKLLFKNRKEYAILTRDELSGWFLSKCGFKVFYDMHGFPEHKVWFWKIAMRTMDGIFVTNKWKVEQLEKRFGIAREKITLATNGFDPVLFNIDISKEEARKKTNVPLDRKIVLYSGHLYDWKGAHVAAGAALFLPEVLFVFVGGSSAEVEEFKKKHGSASNIMFLGQKSHTEIPLYLKAADILILPNSAKAEKERFAVYSRFDTSPIKMFEYMASGTSIVASDLPSIREILNDRNAFFVEPDKPESFVEQIKKIFETPSEAFQKGEQAQKDVQVYTWQNRAKIMFDFVNIYKRK